MTQDHGTPRERTRLEAYRAELVRAREDFEHELRRVGDALERVGGRAPDLEARTGLLRRNRDHCVKEIAKTDRALAALKTP